MSNLSFTLQPVVARGPFLSTSSGSAPLSMACPPFKALLQCRRVHMPRGTTITHCQRTHVFSKPHRQQNQAIRPSVYPSSASSLPTLHGSVTPLAARRYRDATGTLMVSNQLEVQGPHTEASSSIVMQSTREACSSAGVVGPGGEYRPLTHNRQQHDSRCTTSQRGAALEGRRVRCSSQVSSSSRRPSLSCARGANYRRPRSEQSSFVPIDLHAARNRNNMRDQTKAAIWRASKLRRSLDVTGRATGRIAQEDSHDSAADSTAQSSLLLLDALSSVGVAIGAPCDLGPASTALQAFRKRAASAGSVCGQTAEEFWSNDRGSKQHGRQRRDVAACALLSNSSASIAACGDLLQDPRPHTAPTAAENRGPWQRSVGASFNSDMLSLFGHLNQDSRADANQQDQSNNDAPTAQEYSMTTSSAMRLASAAASNRALTEAGRPSTSPADMRGWRGNGHMVLHQAQHQRRPQSQEERMVARRRTSTRTGRASGRPRQARCKHSSAQSIGGDSVRRARHHCGLEGWQENEVWDEDDDTWDGVESCLTGDTSLSGDDSRRQRRSIVINLPSQQGTVLDDAESEDELSGPTGKSVWSEGG